MRIGDIYTCIKENGIAEPGEKFRVMGFVNGSALLSSEGTYKILRTPTYLKRYFTCKRAILSEILHKTK